MKRKYQSPNMNEVYINKPQLLAGSGVYGKFNNESKYDIGYGGVDDDDDLDVD